MVMIRSSCPPRILPALLAGMIAVMCAVPVHGAPSESDPLTPQARFMSGKLYIGQKLYERAEEQIRVAVEGDSTKAVYRAWWAIALCEVAAERLQASASIRDLDRRIEALRALEPLYRQAFRQFSRAQELDPDDMPRFCADHQVHYWVDGFKQAEGMFRNHNYEESLALLRVLAELDPSEPQGFLTMAHCLDKLDRQHEAVEQAGIAVELALAKIAEADCDNLRTRKARLDCTRRRDQHRQIVDNVDSFLRSRNLVLGNQAFDASMAAEGIEERRRHLGDAVLYFEKSLAIDPRLDVVRFRLGNAYYSLAETYGEEGDTARAHQLYRRSAVEFFELANAESLSANVRGDALFNGKNALYAIRAWGELLPYLEHTVDIDPRDAAAYRRVAECLAELKRSQEAVSYLMMCNALSENGVMGKVAELTAAVRASVDGGDEAEALRELGDPDEIRTYREMDSGRTIRTWIWWNRGEVRHFVDGRAVGAIAFTPPAG